MYIQTHTNSTRIYVGVALTSIDDNNKPIEQSMAIFVT